MIIVAITTKGKEFLYSARSAHEVSKRSARKIVDVLNKYRVLLKNDSDIWHIYEVDKYDMAFDYANDQKFTVYNGIVRRKYSYNYM